MIPAEDEEEYGIKHLWLIHTEHIIQISLCKNIHK